MSFDDYVHHILQKYRFAAAIAVIKNKPNNLSLENYIVHLRNKITSEMDNNDPDITICEDDFDFNDDHYDNNDNDNHNDRVVNDDNYSNQLSDSQMNDSCTILKGFDFDEMMRNHMNNDRNEDANEISHVLMTLKGDIDVGGNEIENSQTSFNINQTQSTFYDSSQSRLPPTNDSIDQRNEFHNKNNKKIRNNNAEFKDTSKGKANSNTENHNNISKDKPTDSTCYDSQKTVLYTLKGFTELTHFSQSQVDSIVLPKHLIITKMPTDHLKSITDNYKDGQTDINNSITADKYISNHINDSTRTVSSIIRNRNENEGTNFDENARINIVDKDFGPKIGKMKQVCQKTDSRLPKARNVTVLADNKKHKPSNDDNLDETNNKRSKFIENMNKMDYLNEIRSQLGINENKTDFSKKLSNCNIYGELRDIGNTDEGDIVQCVTTDPLSLLYVCTDNTEELTKGMDETTDYTQNTNSQTSVNTKKCTVNIREFSNMSQNFDDQLVCNNKTLDPLTNNQFKMSENFENGELNKANVDEINIFDVSRNIDLLEDMFDDITDSQTEVVPFKVLEELNKVKAFLNKRDRKVNADCLSDSGYRSDTQSRGSYKSAFQLSNSSLNQSAHCLLSYITRCPLGVSSADITNEIAKVLGQLIDRLHEEENYLSFLEELLEFVRNIIKKIHEGEDEILKKDEDIHRLFLLTKSTHIIKFTIENIVSILDQYHSKLVDEVLIEITETTETDNLAHIFHILETLIKKHMVCTNLSSQCSQPSQDDVLKKSSITDIWRKKWNVKKTEIDANAGSQRKCVLSLCGEALNKIVVQAIDGYSLVAFSALQCFNLLQN